jgi:hypothetical protein
MERSKGCRFDTPSHHFERLFAPYIIMELNDAFPSRRYSLTRWVMASTQKDEDW